MEPETHLKPSGSDYSFSSQHSYPLEVASLSENVGPGANILKFRGHSRKMFFFSYVPTEIQEEVVIGLLGGHMVVSEPFKVAKELW